MTSAPSVNAELGLTLGGQVWQPTILPRRPAEFDRHVLTFDIARLAKPLRNADSRLAIGSGEPE